MGALATAIAIPPVALADSPSGCDFAPNGTNACLGPLPGSTFGGGDGNLLPSPPGAYGTTDWSNVANLNVGIDLTSGPTDNAFGQGTKEDNAAVTVVLGSIPPNKSDLTRFYEASETNASNQTFLYLAWERANVLGSANIDFEINQQTTKGFTSSTTGPVTLNRTAGDLLVTFDFTNGGSTPTIGLLTWLTSANGSASQCFSGSSLPCWGNQKTLAFPNSEGAVNTDIVTDPIAPNAPRQMPAFTFGETAINLTGAGVFPPNVCEAFGSAFVKSRSSASFTAEVKDFIAPIAVNITNCKNPTISTTVFDATTNKAWSGSEVVGASAYDTATLTGASATAGGTVTYYFFGAGQTCTNGTIPAAGTFTNSFPVTVTSGTVPNSPTVGPLAAGSYNFLASYGGDTINHANVSACEPFAVGKANTTTSTVVVDETSASNVPPGTVSLGDIVHDTATVGTQIDGTVISGTVTYTFFTGGDCTTGTPASAGTVTLAGGLAPISNSEGPLSAGSYAFQATYNGDSNYSASTSSCEPFSIGKVNTTTSTVVVDETSASNVPPGTVSLGDIVHDTATVGTQVDGKVISGTVTYTFFTGGDCTTGTPAAAGTVTLAGGLAPISNSEGPLGAGSYAFQATYNGDSNYSASTSSCEPFSIAKANTTTSTVVVDETSASNVPPGTVSLGDIVHDTATVGTQVDGKVISGTVTYTFFSGGDCTTGTPAAAGTVTLSGGLAPISNSEGPLSAGSYAFQATYNGDTNYNASTSSCEPFSIGKVNTNTSTTVVDETSASNVPPGTVSLGDIVHDTATVGTQVDGKVISGTLTYTFFTGGDCLTGTPAAAGTVTLSGGLAPISSSEGPLGAGSYAFQATYNGDTNYNSSTSSCEPFTIPKNLPAIATAQNLLPNDTATLSGGFNPTGNITFSLFSPSDATCSGTPAFTQSVGVNGNSAYLTTNTTTFVSDPGEWRWQVMYSGDANNQPATSFCGTENFTITNVGGK
jgi:stalled ribosome alternative rescue factor ArfA